MAPEALTEEEPRPNEIIVTSREAAPNAWLAAYILNGRLCAYFIFLVVCVVVCMEVLPLFSCQLA